MKTLHEWIETHTLDQLQTGVYCFVDDRRERGNTGDLQCGELGSNTIDIVSHVGQTVALTHGADCLLKRFERLGRLSGSRLELLVVELHVYDAVINTTHAVVTFFHTSSAIWSNIGLIAGLM